MLFVRVRFCFVIASNLASLCVITPFLARVRVSSRFVVESSLSSSMSNILPGASCCLLLRGKVPVFSVGIWDPETGQTHCARVRKRPSTSVRKRSRGHHPSTRAVAFGPLLLLCVSKVLIVTVTEHGAGLRGEALLLRRM